MTPTTVKVHIAVVVDYRGNWAARGASEVADSYIVRRLQTQVDKPQELFYVDADLPIPAYSPQVVLVEDGAIVE
jgi:hypothetical protein